MPDNSRQESLEFDRKLGSGFIAQVPAVSGVYLFRDGEGRIIYVGKAKNLRRRLSQYRLAPRTKPYRKMRLIVKSAASLEYQLCSDEREALLLENQLILEHRPGLNVAGAYSFLYPYLGIRQETGRSLSLCYTTTPDPLIRRDFELSGAFRSRQLVGAAFDAFAFALPFVGHPSPRERKEFGDIPYSRILCFRQIPDDYAGLLSRFFRGESSDFVGRLLMDLLEKPSARQARAEVQTHIENLQAFYAGEARKLRDAMGRNQHEGTMIPQSERDRLFLSHR